MSELSSGHALVSPDALTWGKKSMAQYLHCPRRSLPERRIEGAAGDGHREIDG